MNNKFIKFSVLSSVMLLVGCSSYAPMSTVKSVDLQRFMGDWYVIANIPTFIEKEAFNPVENYRLQDDGSIATTFTFNKGSFDGPLKTYRPTGYVEDTETNAIWGMQFIWPFKGDFRIVYLDENYQNTIIAREARDYVWLMSRQPTISQPQFDRFKLIIEQLGYDISELQRPAHREVHKADVEKL